MSDNVLAELEQLKRKIDDTAAERNRLEGELRQLKTSLREALGTDDLKAAELKIERLKAQAAAIREGLEKGIVSLREELGA